jgi:hypothetical protein
LRRFTLRAQLSYLLINMNSKRNLKRSSVATTFRTIKARFKISQIKSLTLKRQIISLHQ